VAELEKISSSEYAIDGNLSRFVGMPPLVIWKTSCGRAIFAKRVTTSGHKSRAASMFGVHPRTLTWMMSRCNIPDNADAKGISE